ncbi:MAG: PLD nuclease N-terminal domain-containing protein [Candidatus Eremiobacterota bacterium]
MSAGKLITLTEIICVFLILWVAMSIYKDARNRNMWALLWTYVAILLPVAGWILYFFLRSPVPKNQCPDCFERTARRDIFCYRCSYNFVNIAKERNVLNIHESKKKK